MSNVRKRDMHDNRASDAIHLQPDGCRCERELYKYGPFLVNVQDCSFVRQTFSEIENMHCPGLRKYNRWIYIGLVMVAIAVMLSLLFWVIYRRERRHRVYTKAHTPPPEGPGFGKDNKHG